ncbi:hypothetical protein [Fusobacterium necrophorum]|uniref:Uncharacterized protein n=3 Tax=Fusobacterium necrophorum TaxID=859 RepID=A0AAN3VXD9_9FUSO|nr:hypothetical protein [Fusobacterium necrophorum]AYV94666.1 hypothetical protein BWX37_03110 [Fusobacterium necrophorum subsp. funduliforme]EJU18822.1 hypothetical protein HMPREF1127_1114 [Fusobacterium necrophorum subsp. funduliforme Fnf 1007]KYL03324.1 hypothetical protein A2J06_09320 [Fusobacterium necrophorum subsp. funduliforme]KYM40882.1 hypothetical protein A2U03_03625 [Fusobacterium necrophorum subsp. funduliforme]KYM51147.1 hypothetical protein A2U04_00005 [Fusobacterium necrophorum
MKEINVTRHALMRYAARVYKAAGITDRTFDSWRKRHEQEAQELEKCLKLEFKQAEYVTTAQFEGHKKAEFYIRKDIMMTYVASGENLVTCYYIDFGLDDTGNREMLEVLFKNLRRAIEEEENFERKNEERVVETKNSLSKVKADLAEYGAIINKLIEKQNIFENQLKLIELEKKELSETINNAREKIVRSKKAM